MKLNEPEKYTHFYVNARKRKTYYQKTKDGFLIYNKGLGVWEKVSKLLVEPIPFQESVSNDVLDLYSTETTTITVEETSVQDKDDFKNPPVVLKDFKYLENLFKKHGEKNTGFLPAHSNYYLIFDHTYRKWSYKSVRFEEIFTIYTTDLNVILKVVESLNNLLDKKVS